MKRFFVVVVVLVLALALPQMAQAHGRFPLAPCLAGGIIGLLLGGAAASHPPYPPAVAPPPPQPTQCFERILEHWGEPRWDPSQNTYVREKIPEHYVKIPCR